ncbi:MAG: hypothetical protein EXS35_15140 [Pedosphaera sp.]|nr:hypothetical protein [Pedosphaera sp.]
MLWIDTRQVATVQFVSNFISTNIQPLAIFINQRENTAATTEGLSLNTYLLAEPAANRGMISIPASPSALQIVKPCFDITPLKISSRQIGVITVLRQNNNFTVTAHSSRSLNYVAD